MKGGHKAVQGFAEAHPPHGHGLTTVLSACEIPGKSVESAVSQLRAAYYGLLVREKHMRLRRAYWKGKGAADEDEDMSHT